MQALLISAIGRSSAQHCLQAAGLCNSAGPAAIWLNEVEQAAVAGEIGQRLEQADMIVLLLAVQRHSTGFLIDHFLNQLATGSLHQKQVLPVLVSASRPHLGGVLAGLEARLSALGAVVMPARFSAQQPAVQHSVSSGCGLNPAYCQPQPA